MGTPGERLRLARERAGLSIDDIARRTKIQVSLLEAIEKDDFAHVPGGLFVRGFLRAYAREVGGLEPEAVVADYLDQYEPRAPEAEEAVRPQADARQDEILAQPDFQGFSWRKVWPAVAVAAILVGVFMTAGSDSSNAPVAEAQPVGTSGTTDRVAEPRPAPAQTLTLDVRAKRDVWVAATGDGKRAVYRILKTGEQATITARGEITARIGDAEALEYSINGVAGQPLGAAGEVRDILITPDGFRTFEVIRPAPPQAPKEPGGPGAW